MGELTDEHKDTETEEVIVEQSADFEYIIGWRLHLITAGLALSLFLVNFEITIVSTALVSISNDLHDFGRNGWVVTGYLLTYTSKKSAPVD
ncbi:putative efflux pump antibiotic resistance protein [Eutypa lata UCREL1]|uniref:Putative efflux pump antibiotic resistance protein n=1 Tax=Eutypa lata (strain UCR-EL1) TaxID=1287681 RepID=M7SDP7_EUTLA|nr:putative efflux pump antibiotic resistance protein [Eutypa lata UCREL1]